MQELDIQFVAVGALVKSLGLPLTIFDLETTTFRGRANFAVTEVACFSVLKDGSGLVHGHLINPERPIDTMVTKITGITGSMLRNKETWGERYAGLFNRLAREHWVGGFNIRTFDCPAVVEMNARYDQPLATGFERLLDVRQLYLTLEQPKTKKGTLSQVAEFYGVTPKGQLHRANADVILTLETLDAMVTGYGVEAVVAALVPAAKKVKTKAPPARVAAVPASAGSDALVTLAGSGLVTTLPQLAAELGIELRTASFNLGKAVDERLVSPLPFANVETLDWLRTMLVEVPTDTLADGRLKPIYEFLASKQPEGLNLDYLQLRIGMMDSGLSWTTLRANGPQ